MRLNRPVKFKIPPQNFPIWVKTLLIPNVPAVGKIRWITVKQETKSSRMTAMPTPPRHKQGRPWLTRSDSRAVGDADGHIFRCRGRDVGEDGNEQSLTRPGPVGRGQHPKAKHSFHCLAAPSVSDEYKIEPHDRHGPGCASPRWDPRVEQGIYRNPQPNPRSGGSGSGGGVVLAALADGL